MANLVGIYEIEKSRLNPSYCSDFHLVISKRHKQSANKPADYLLIKQSGKFFYLSSLYSASGHVELLGADGWLFEVKGIHYLLKLDRAENRAEISLRGHVQSGGLKQAA